MIKKLWILIIIGVLLFTLYKFHDYISFFWSYAKFNILVVSRFNFDDPNLIFYLSKKRYTHTYVGNKDIYETYPLKVFNLHDGTYMDMCIPISEGSKLDPYFSSFVKVRGKLSTSIRSGGMLLQDVEISSDDERLMPVKDLEFPEIVKIERFTHYDGYMSWDKDMYIFKDYKDNKKDVKCKTYPSIIDKVNENFKMDLNNTVIVNPKNNINAKNIVMSVEYILTLSNGDKVAIDRSYENTVLCRNNLICSDEIKNLSVGDSRAGIHTDINPKDIFILYKNNLENFMMAQSHMGNKNCIIE